LVLLKDEVVKTMGACLFVGLSTIVLAANTQAQEEKVNRSDLPPAVQKTVEAQSQGTTVRGFAKEKEDGQTFYEVEMTVNGHSKDVLMDKSGAVVEIEEEVAMDSLPPGVKEG
jgi:hypothetical protein